MNSLNSFSFGRNPIRVVLVAGEPRWVAKDVAEALGYTWSGSRIKHVPAEWRGMSSVVTPSGNQDMATLSEAGLFFFLSRSDKPAALPFQKWVAGEVLPSIRKTGAFSLAGEKKPRLSGAFIARTREQIGFEGTTTVLERIWPEWFANLPGKRPAPPQDVVTRTLNLEESVIGEFELRAVPKKKA